MTGDDEQPLSEDEAYQRLWKARQALGDEPGATMLADTTLAAARRSLTLLQLGLLKSQEDRRDDNAAVIPPAPSPPQKPPER